VKRFGGDLSNFFGGLGFFLYGYRVFGEDFWGVGFFAWGIGGVFCRGHIFMTIILEFINLMKLHLVL
jgi:hypothetical protein